MLIGWLTVGFITSDTTTVARTDGTQLIARVEAFISSIPFSLIVANEWFDNRTWFWYVGLGWNSFGFRLPNEHYQ